jgi:hypothetical protein
MKTVSAVLLVFSMVPVLHACSMPKVVQDKLALRQDGDDVVVSTSVSSSGPGQMVMKSYEIDARNRVTLQYCLIQSEENSGLQSWSTVKIEWRLKGVRLGDLTFKVEGKKLVFEQDELDQLRDQLNQQFRPRRDASLRGE